MKNTPGNIRQVNFITDTARMICLIHLKNERRIDDEFESFHGNTGHSFDGCINHLVDSEVTIAEQEMS